MPRSQRSLPGHFANDADFRTWMQGIHDQILAVGMVDVTTNPLDFATATRPTAGGDTDRLRVYRFPDADPAQATFPIFLRVNWGTGASADRPAMTFRVGSGVNASNLLTGQIGNAYRVEGGVSNAGDVWNSYVCAEPDEGRFTLCNNLRADQKRYIFFHMERNRGADNAVAADGVFTWAGGGSSSNIRQMLPRVGSIPGTSFGQPGGPIETGQGITLWGNDVALIPMVAYIGRPWILRGIVGYKSADLSEQQSVAAEHMGEQRTFMPLGLNGPESHSSSGAAVAMAWDA